MSGVERTFNRLGLKPDQIMEVTPPTVEYKVQGTNTQEGKTMPPDQTKEQLAKLDARLKQLRKIQQMGGDTKAVKSEIREI